MIRVAFRYGDSRLFARLVCLVQGGDSAHCEVAHAWDGALHQCVSSSFVDGGVRGKAIVLPAEKWRIYAFTGIEPDVVTAWLDEHRGQGYDRLGLLGFLVRRVKGSRKEWFCSEAAADMLSLRDPWRYDLALLESVCATYGEKVQ